MPARSKDGLLDTCFQRFSELRASERLFYDDTTPETIADGGYVVSQRSKHRDLCSRQLLDSCKRLTTPCWTN
jgi:hypothetical protein